MADLSFITDSLFACLEPGMGLYFWNLGWVEASSTGSALEVSKGISIDMLVAVGLL
jgi:hypothetical protein